jgi:hypothetical protein
MNLFNLLFLSLNHNTIQNSTNDINFEIDPRKKENSIQKDQISLLLHQIPQRCTCQNMLH